MRTLRPYATVFCISWFMCAVPSTARADRAYLTVPVILADYYVFAYAQAFKDRSFGYAYSTVAVDAIGWGMAAAGKYPGLFCVNLAGLAKTVYPAVILCGKPNRDVKRRAWISIGTHTCTLLWLKAWSKPALKVETSYRPPDGGDVRLALLF